MPFFWNAVEQSSYSSIFDKMENYGGVRKKCQEPFCWFLEFVISHNYSNLWNFMQYDDACGFCKDLMNKNKIVKR